jgi:hypothetical protein
MSLSNGRLSQQMLCHVKEEHHWQEAAVVVVELH